MMTCRKYITTQNFLKTSVADIFSIHISLQLRGIFTFNTERDMVLYVSRNNSFFRVAGMHMKPYPDHQGKQKIPIVEGEL